MLNVLSSSVVEQRMLMVIGSDIKNILLICDGTKNASDHW